MIFLVNIDKMQIIIGLLADYYLLLVGIGIDELLGCLVLI